MIFLFHINCSKCSTRQISSISISISGGFVCPVNGFFRLLLCRAQFKELGRQQFILPCSPQSWSGSAGHFLFSAKPVVHIRLSALALPVQPFPVYRLDFDFELRGPRACTSVRQFPCCFDRIRTFLVTFHALFVLFCWLSLVDTFTGLASASAISSSCSMFWSCEKLPFVNDRESGLEI